MGGFHFASAVSRLPLLLVMGRFGSELQSEPEPNLTER